MKFKAAAEAHGLHIEKHQNWTVTTLAPVVVVVIVVIVFCCTFCHNFLYLFCIVLHFNT